MQRYTVTFTSVDLVTFLVTTDADWAEAQRHIQALFLEPVNAAAVTISRTPAT